MGELCVFRYVLVMGFTLWMISHSTFPLLIHCPFLNQLSLHPLALTADKGLQGHNNLYHKMNDCHITLLKGYHWLLPALCMWVWLPLVLYVLVMVCGMRCMYIVPLVSVVQTRYLQLVITFAVLGTSSWLALMPNSKHSNCPKPRSKSNGHR